MTPPDSKQNLFLCLVGLSPAVITETLWALATRKEDPVIPDRILAVTTSSGRDHIETVLFRSNQWNRFKEHLAQKSGQSILGKLKFSNIPECIRVFPKEDYTGELEDIRTEADSLAVAEFLMEIIRGLVEDEQVRLITSIAGGRKTSGVLLHSVMTLVGRESDLITHVLVEEPYDRIPEFLCPGLPERIRHPDTGALLETRSTRIQLSEIPFVPLRCVFRQEMGNAAGSYLNLINQLRTRAINLDRDLEIRLQCGDGKLVICGTGIPCSAIEFAYYLYFAERAANGFSELPAYAGIDEELIQRARQHGRSNDFHHWSHQVLERASGKQIDAAEDARKWASNLRKALRAAKFAPIEIDRLVPRRGRLSIDLPPNNITIVNA